MLFDCLAFMKIEQLWHRRASPPKLQRRRGFTLPEAVLVLVVVMMLAMLLPVLLVPKRIASRTNCMNGLKEMGVAFGIWQGNNNDKYPMNVPVALGGAQELIATGNVAGCFRVMSNELSAPMILTCSRDFRHPAATNWNDLTGSNMSYFIGLGATEADPQAILSGDANLVQHGRAVPSGFLNLATNSTSWTPERHLGSGNILIADGSVERLRQIGFSNSSGWVFFLTNRVVVP